MLMRETVKNYMNTRHMHLTLFSATHNVFLYQYYVDMCVLCYYMSFLHYVHLLYIYTYIL